MVNEQSSDYVISRFAQSKKLKPRKDDASKLQFSSISGKPIHGSVTSSPYSLASSSPPSTKPPPPVQIPFVHPSSSVSSHRRFRSSYPQIEHQIRRESCVGGVFRRERGDRLLADDARGLSFNGGVFIAIAVGLTVGYLVFRSDDDGVNAAVENPCAVLKSTNGRAGEKQDVRWSR
ncbi:hypothetical protein Bca101_001027 [Brassica carinata]